MNDLTEKELIELVEIFPKFILTLDNPSVNIQKAAVSKEPTLITKIKITDAEVYKSAFNVADTTNILVILDEIPKSILTYDDIFKSNRT